MNEDEVDELVADFWDERRAVKRDAAKWRALGLPDDCDPATVRSWLIHTMQWVTTYPDDNPPEVVAIARHIEEQQ